MHLTVISFYTNNWEYPAYAEKLRQQCDKFNLKHHIQLLPDTGDWLKNTKLKPQFILDAILQVKGPVLWIDVDGSLLAPPTFILDRMHTMDFMVKLKPNGHKRKFHVGTMFFNNTESSIYFLKDWISECEKSYASDELHLDNLWKRFGDEYTMKWCDIPKEYFVMLKNNTDKPPYDTVICHRESNGTSKRNLKAKRII